MAEDSETARLLLRYFFRSNLYDTVSLQTFQTTFEKYKPGSKNNPEIIQFHRDFVQQRKDIHQQIKTNIRCRYPDVFDGSHEVEMEQLTNREETLHAQLRSLEEEIAQYKAELASFDQYIASTNKHISLDDADLQNLHRLYQILIPMENTMSEDEHQDNI